MLEMYRLATRLISIHALREEGDGPEGIIIEGLMISIHALREEGDFLAAWHGLPGRNFYPRPPRGGRPGPESVNGKNCGISIHALREEGDAIRSIMSGI